MGNARRVCEMVDDARYTCEIGDFYKVFAQRDDSWEFRGRGMLKESDLAEALEIIRGLKQGRPPVGPPSAP